MEDKHLELVRDIAYAPAHGERGLLDLALPDDANGRPVVMVVHGGGLQALSKARMDRVAEFVAEQGWAAVNVNYRHFFFSAADGDFAFPAELTLGVAFFIR